MSIGAESMVPEKFQTAAILVEAADNALYAAKRRGAIRRWRGCLHYFAPRREHRSVLYALAFLFCFLRVSGLAFAARFFLGGAQIMPSSFIPSGSVK